MEKSSGKEQKITITNDKGRMSAEEIDRLVAEAERYKAEDDANMKRIEAKNGLENYLFQLKNSLGGSDGAAGGVSDDDKAKILAEIEKARDWLDANQSANLEEFEAKRKEVEAIVMPILTAASSGSGSGPDFEKGPFTKDMGAGVDPDEGPKIEEID